MAQKKSTKKTEYFVLKGELVFNGTFNSESTTKYDRNAKIRFSVKNPTFKDDDDLGRLLHCYDDVTSVFMPKFVTEGIGEYFNFKTSYTVPVFDVAGKEIADSDINPHAECYVAFKCAVENNSAAIYPTEIKVIKNGTKRESALAQANW